ncbi:MAG: YaaC family protein [Alphaproteobacteria bacterium]|nr:YaaC family protein [Alphaproteobacteria bacterium]MBU0833713.1 YaaC family protein [Alphaproteobacteria bacterium]MBU1765955.1 YaaC family protein [Alphaproteobacteria bacterium]
MPASILVYRNRDVYFQKAISDLRIGEKSILARDAFQYVDLWLNREAQKDALFYWQQARSFYLASKALPTSSSPLTAYYCMLNAVKTLLVVKSISYKEWHGVSGSGVQSRKSIDNETTELHNAGVMAELSKYLKEPETTRVHSLSAILSNLPFLHRAYALTKGLRSELFVNIHNVSYVRHPTLNKVWFSAEVHGQDADGRVLRHMPPGFEIDDRGDRLIIRKKARVDWFARQGATDQDKDRAMKRFQTYHRNLRLDVVPISAPTGLWYLKRRIASIPAINRYGLTLMMMGMHRLSELARYDPKGLSAHLAGKSNWLLTEFIELSPSQFIDEIACEITGLEFRMPGVRL